MENIASLRKSRHRPPLGRGGGGKGKESIHNELQGKKEQITALMEDPEIFKELGILIDPEVAT